MFKSAEIKTGRERRSRTISFSCSQELLKTMDDYLSERGCTRSWLLSRALESYLAECLEDKEDYETAAAAWKEFEASGETGFTLEEVRKELGL